MTVSTQAGHTKLFCLPLLTLLFPVAQAAALPGSELSDLPLEQLLDMQISTASKFAQPLSEAPSSVSIISAADIRHYGWRTLAELLSSLRGLYSTNDRNYSYLGARGFLRPGDYNTRFLLLIDGTRANSAEYDQALLGQDFMLDLDLVERVEYVPGPGSSVYGSNAFFGVVNVITRHGRDQPGTTASVSLGSAGERTARASIGWRGADTANSFLISASAYQRDGDDLYFPEFAATPSGGVAHGLDYETADSVFFKGDAGALNFSAAHVRRKKGIPTASFSQIFDDPRAQTLDSQSIAALSYRAVLPAQSSLHTRLFWGRHDYSGNYAYANPDKLNYDASSATWWGGEISLVSTYFKHHKLLAGIEYQRDARLRQYSRDDYPPGSTALPTVDALHVQSIVLLDDERQATRTGLYLQDEYAISDDVLLNAGLRYDNNSLSSTALSPRLAVIARLGPDSTVKLIAGSAFRSPNAYELYYSIPGVGGQKINPQLKPEHIRTRELSWEKQLSAQSKLIVLIYQNSVSDLISSSLDPYDGLLGFKNLDRARARGFEAGYERVWKDGAHLRSSYSWQLANDDSSGAILVNAPRQLAKLNLGVPLAQAYLGLEAQYVARRATLQSELGGYTLVNANLWSAQWFRQAGLSLGIYNLFNHRYAIPGGPEHLQDGLQQDGRSYRVKLTFSF